MLRATCKETSDPFKLACLLFETFLVLLLICWFFVSVHRENFVCMFAIRNFKASAFRRLKRINAMHGRNRDCMEDVVKQLIITGRVR